MRLLILLGIHLINFEITQEAFRMKKIVVLLMMCICIFTLVACKDVNKINVLVNIGTPKAEEWETLGNPITEGKDNNQDIFLVDGEKVTVYYELNTDGVLTVSKVEVD